jgi:ADP-ribose pyrophosphatase YjhB (NUDIX family)
MIWTPHVTVAAIVENEGKFLVVEEHIDNKIVYNQPAGHLEKNETLLQAVIREVREETARRFIPDKLVGVYRMQIDETGITYLRFCFTGRCTDHQPGQQLDKEIIQTLWLSQNELHARHDALRSPLVLQCIDDYVSGQYYSLDILKDLGNI